MNLRVTQRQKEEKMPFIVASKLHDPGAGGLVCLPTFVPSGASRVSALAY